LVQWSTIREPSVDYFEVERSQDLNENTLISEKYYSKGSEEGGASYIFWDAERHIGTSYYRIKAVNNDGGINYSQWKSVWFGEVATLKLSVFPNPTKGQLNVQFESEQNQSIALQLTDINGKVLWTKAIDEAYGQFDIEIQMDSFAEGMYILDLKTSKGMHKSLRVMKRR
jgi:hypothetical protein